MEFPEDQIEELRQICAEAEPYEEASIPYFFLPKLSMPNGCSPKEIDALLCPTGHHGYTSRLFLAQRVISPLQRNWSTEARIMERIWHAISWNIPETNLRLAQILALHMRAFR